MTQSPSQGLVRWLWREYFARHLGLLLLAFCFMALEGSMLGVMSWMMKPMFDEIFVGGRQDLLLWVGLAFLGVFVIRGLASVMQKVLVAWLSQLSLAAIRADLLAHLMRLDQAFHQANPPGALMQRVEGDVDTIKQVWQAVITGVGRDLVSVITLLGVAFWVDWRWTLVALIGVPLLVAPSAFLQRFVRRNARSAHETSARLATRLNEVFHGLVQVKLNGLERYQSDRYAEITQDRVRVETRSALGQGAIPGLIDVMSGVGFLGVMYLGGAQIIAGEKTVGDFMAFFTAIALAFEPLRRLGAISGLWQASAAGVERIRALFAMQPSITSPAQPLDIPAGTPGIVIENARLRYGDLTVLDGLDLIAPAGKTTALVGASGAGKSTVFNVLTRLVDIQNGSVRIGDKDIDTLSLTDLRGLISVVSQDVALFDESLRENILLGRDVAQCDLEQALRDAHVDDFLSRLPDGLDTQVGARGSALSGGQRQRVAIARALLRDTPILLLDEATSALDAQSEAVVQSALERLSQGRTTIVIAHRLSTIRNADKIIVMDQGRIIDQGRHDELLSRGGLYAELCKLQFGKDA